MNKSRHRGIKERNNSEQSGDIHALYEEYASIFIIAKSIDEIARRANIIALMAAVEAKRAGKEGTAFAAMAKEARDLAIMSADTVGDTSRYIENTVRIVESISVVTKLSMKHYREKQEVA